MKLSLVIPCYNESANLPLLVDRVSEVFAGTPHEVLLVDNGSSDDSWQVMQTLLTSQPNIRAVKVEINQGYGFGIVSGLRAAEGDILSWTHADMQTDPADALKALDLYNAEVGQTDVFVKGRRYGRPMADVVFTGGMSVFVTAVMGRRMRDVNAQPTLFSRQFLDSWDNPPNDFSLDLYAYYKARRDGLAIKRFPVLFAERANGESSWNISWSAKRKFIKRTIDYTFGLKNVMRKP